MKFEETRLDTFAFGESAEETFYCLVDRNVSPNGLNLEKIRLLDPRNFDQMLREMGCLMMLTGDEIEELIRRGDLEAEDLHTGLYKLCISEGIFRAD